MSAALRSCFCSHCRTVINFDPKQNGETVSCWACNQDTRLYCDNQETIAQPEKSPPLTGKIGREKHNHIVQVVWIDGVAYSENHPKAKALAQSQSTPTDPVQPEPPVQAPIPQAIPIQPQSPPEPFPPFNGSDMPESWRPVQAPPVALKRKSSWNPWLALVVAIGGFAVCLVLVGIAGRIMEVAEGYANYNYRLEGSGDKLIREIAFAYGSRDHLAHVKPSDDYMSELVKMFSIKDDRRRTVFKEAYDQGWNMVGDPRDHL